MSQNPFSDPFPVDLGTFEVLGDEQGFEAYCSFALTPWAFLTPDGQVVQPAQRATRYGEAVNTASVHGLRLRMVF